MKKWLPLVFVITFFLVIFGLLWIVEERGKEDALRCAKGLNRGLTQVEVVSLCGDPRKRETMVGQSMNGHIMSETWWYGGAALYIVFEGGEVSYWTIINSTYRLYPSPHSSGVYSIR